MLHVLLQCSIELFGFVLKFFDQGVLSLNHLVLRVSNVVYFVVLTHVVLQLSLKLIDGVVQLSPVFLYFQNHVVSLVLVLLLHLLVVFS